MLALTLLPFFSGFFLKLLYRQQCPDGLVDCYNTLPAFSDIYHHVIDPISSSTSSKLLSYPDHHFVHPSPSEDFVNIPMSSMIHYPHSLNQLQFVVELPRDLGVVYLTNHPTLTLAVQPTSTRIISSATRTPEPHPKSNDYDDLEDMSSLFKTEAIEFSSNNGLLQSLFSPYARATARGMMSEIVESYASHPVDTFHNHLSVLQGTIHGELDGMKVDRNVVLSVVLGYWLAIATMGFVRMMIRGLGFIISRTLIRTIKSIFSLFGIRSDQPHNHGGTGRSEILELKADRDLVISGEITPPSTERNPSGKSAKTTSGSINEDTPVNQRNSGMPITPFTPTPLKRTTSMPCLSPTTNVFSDWRTYKPTHEKDSDTGIDVPDLALAISAAVVGFEGSQNHDSPAAEGGSDFFAPYLVDTSPTVDGYLTLDDQDETSSTVTAIHSPPGSSVLEEDLQDNENDKVEVDKVPKKDDTLGMVESSRALSLVETFFNESTTPTSALENNLDDLIEETEPQPSHSKVSSRNRRKPHKKHLDKEPQPSHSELPKKRRKVRGKKKSRPSQGSGNAQSGTHSTIAERALSVSSEVEVDQVVLREEDEISVGICESESEEVAGFAVDVSAEVSKDVQLEEGEEEENADDVGKGSPDLEALEEPDCEHEKSEFEYFDDSTTPHPAPSLATIEAKGKQKEEFTLSDLDSHRVQGDVQFENLPTGGHKKKRDKKSSRMNKKLKRLEEENVSNVQINEGELSTMVRGGAARREEEDDEAEVDGLI